MQSALHCHRGLPKLNNILLLSKSISVPQMVSKEEPNWVLVSFLISATLNRQRPGEISECDVRWRRDLRRHCLRGTSCFPRARQSGHFLFSQGLAIGSLPVFPRPGNRVTSCIVWAASSPSADYIYDQAVLYFFILTTATPAPRNQ